MIWYYLVSLFFIFLLEISGQYFLSKLNIDSYVLSFPIGLLALMAYGYITTSILTASNCSFNLILIIFCLYFLGVFILVLKNIKKVKWKFDIESWIILIVFVGIMIYYALNTTLGDRNGFDSTYYLNLISTNIKANTLNTIDPLYGGYITEPHSSQYTFQSYYYFVSCFVYVVSHLSNDIVTVNNYSIIIWIFQIIYNCFLCSLVLNGAYKTCKDKRLLKYVFIFIFLFFYGKIYYNNVYGFYGNTYRTIAVGYLVLSLKDLLNKDNEDNWILFGINILATCAFSSSGVFTIFFLIYGSYFLLVEKDDYLFRWLGIILFFPLVNLINVVTSFSILLCVIISLLLCILMYVFNDFLIKLSRMKYTRKIILCVSFLVMFGLSFMITKNIFDFSAFFDNLSEKADMTIDYFSTFDVFGPNEMVYRILVLFLLAYVCIFEHKDKLIMIFLILIIVIFNPFCCAFMNRFNIVYYRSYDIIINPYTLILFINMFYKRFSNKYLYYISLIAILIVFALNVDYKTPLYYHSSFIPDDDYNQIMKMSNDEYDVLIFMKKDVDYFEYEEPYIVSTNIFTEALIPNGKYIYGRERRVNKNWSDAEIQLYSIFYPEKYLGEKYEEVEADYNNIDKYIEEAGIYYLVVDKTKEYYDSRGYYSYLINKVASFNYGLSIYCNDTYELFKFK